MLAGYTPLREMMQRAIKSGMDKVAAAEGTPSKTEKVEDKTTVVETEKVASVNDGLDHRNADHMAKLASALEDAGEKLAAGAFLGGEKPQGGETLPNTTPVTGKQSAKKDPAASKAPPMNPPTIVPPDTGKGGPSTAMKSNRTEPAPGGGKYPAKGVLKNASAEIVSKLQAKVTGKPAEKTAAKADTKGAIDFILGRMDKTAAGAFLGGEKKQGGETLSNTERGIPTSGDGNSDRQYLMSNKAPVAMNKRQAKATEKKQMKEVLTEPMQSAAKDSKVQDNLRNASKGGVKIAADVSKALVEKIASGGCKCSGEGTCRFCSMRSKVEEMKAGK